jgi:hypothetical protein
MIRLILIILMFFMFGCDYGDRLDRLEIGQSCSYNFIIFEREISNCSEYQLWCEFKKIDNCYSKLELCLEKATSKLNDANSNICSYRYR